MADHPCTTQADVHTAFGAAGDGDTITIQNNITLTTAAQAALTTGKNVTLRSTVGQHYTLDLSDEYNVYFNGQAAGQTCAIENITLQNAGSQIVDIRSGTGATVATLTNVTLDTPVGTSKPCLNLRIANNRADLTCTCTGCTFTNATAPNGDGVGLVNADNTLGSDLTVTLTDCVAHGNADEGVSPHGDGTSAGTVVLNINGGRYYNNGSTVGQIACRSTGNVTVSTTIDDLAVVSADGAEACVFGDDDGVTITINNACLVHTGTGACINMDDNADLVLDFDRLRLYNFGSGNTIEMADTCELTATGRTRPSHVVM